MEESLGYHRLSFLFAAYIDIVLIVDIVDLLALQEDYAVVDQEQTQLQYLYLLQFGESVVEEMSADQIPEELKAALGYGGEMVDVGDIVRLLQLLLA